MRRVLVTGSSGEIGAAITRALLMDDAIEIVIGLDLHPPAQAFCHEKFHHITADILQTYGSMFAEHAIDTVVHAAYPVEPSHHPSISRRTATAGTRAILERAETAGVRAFLHLSSATVYGAHPANPPLLPETAPLQPNAHFDYALDKLAAEEIVEEFRTRNVFETLIVLRPCFVVGPNTANAFMRHLCRSVVFLPATQSPMQFVHRDDVVRIVMAALRGGASGIYNVGAPGNLTSKAMVERLHGRPLIVPDRILNAANTFGWKAHLRIAPSPTPAIELLRYSWRVDSTALQQLIPHPYNYTTTEAFQSFADAYLLSRRPRG